MIPTKEEQKEILQEIKEKEAELKKELEAESKKCLICNKDISQNEVFCSDKCHKEQLLFCKSMKEETQKEQRAIDRENKDNPEYQENKHFDEWYENLCNRAAGGGEQ